MSNALFLIFNHQLTKNQEVDALTSLGVDQIVKLPAELEELWRQVPPAISKTDSYLEPIRRWLSDHASESDYVLIQGDFGATYILVNYAFEKGLIPIYSSTHREAFEEQQADGTVALRHMFRHTRFRRYGD